MQDFLVIQKVDFDKLNEKLTSIESLLRDSKASGPDEEILTVHEACKMLKVSEPTLYRYIRHLELPTHKFGNQRRFRKSELMEWLNQQNS